MNILFITYQGDIAGSTNSIAYLSKGLADKGHSVYVGCRKESLLFSLLEGSGVNRIPMTFKSKFDLENIKQIKDAVRKYNIEIINAQSSKDRYTTILARLFYNLDVKIVHTRRQTPKSIGGFIQNFIYTKGTEKIIAISSQLKETLIKKGLPEDHIHVIFNGTPKKKYENIETDIHLKKRLGIQEGDIVIGCVSRRKKQEQLVEALQFLPANIKVIFVGIAPNSLDEYVEKFKVKQKIIYAGVVSPTEVLAYYKLFTVKVLPSTMDGFGLALVEAMALGVPVIGTRAEGIIDVIEDGKSGLLFEDGNAFELAQKIKTVIEDDSLKAELIENGKRRSLVDFSMERTVENYEKFFSSIL